MTPTEIRAVRARLGLSAREFGEALGLADAERTVRGWEAGARNGKPFEPTGTAVKALEYLLAIRDCWEAYRSIDNHDSDVFAALAGLRQVLPERLR